MPTTDPVLRAGAAVARASQTADPAKITEARRNLNAAYVERAIQKALDAAPPLTAEQRDRLAALLTGGAS